MRVTKTHTFSAAYDDVSALAVDEAFQRERVTADGSSSTASVSTAGDGAVVRIERQLSTEGAPDMMKRFVGDAVTIVEERTWAPRSGDGERTARLRITAGKAPVSVDGSMTLSPDGSGCRLSLEGDARCSVPIVGRSVEPQLVEVVAEAFDEEVAAMTRRLEG